MNAAEILSGAFRRQGPGEVESLHEAATEGHQALGLIGVLDAFGQRLQVQRLSKLHDSPGDGRVLRATGQAIDEGLVDLQDVDGERRRWASDEFGAPSPIGRTAPVP